MKRLLVLLLGCVLLATFLNSAVAYEFDTTQLTFNETNDHSPTVYNNTIAWKGWDGHDWEIYYWEGDSIIQITDNESDESDPSLYDGTIAWRGWDGSDWEIYYWDGTDTTKVTDNDMFDGSPFLYDGEIAWGGFDGIDWEVYHWDGNNITQITDDYDRDNFASIYDGTIAWSSQGDIYYLDGNSVTRVTNDSIYNYFLSLYDGTIAWTGNDGKIYFWDGTSVVQVSGDGVFCSQPSLYDSTIAWQCGGNIYYWDGTTITQVTDNFDFYSSEPSFHYDMIAWQGYDGNDFEIFFAMFGPVLVSATIDITPDTLNLQSRGKWITCFIELPDEYNVEQLKQIDINSIVLSAGEFEIASVPAKSPTVTGDFDLDGAPDLMVKFDRKAVQDAVTKSAEGATELTLTVSGHLANGDYYFQGSDVVRIIDKGKQKDKDNGKGKGKNR